MTDEQRVDAFDLRQVLRGVLLARRSPEPRNARVTERNDEIDAFLLQIGDFRPRRFDDVDEPQSAGDMGFVPLRDLHWREADDAHFQQLRRAALIDERALDHHRRRKPRGPVRSQNVAADDRKARRSVGALDNVESIVELVIAQRCGRVVQSIHRGDHRMVRTRTLPHGLSGEIAERRALKNVAIVEQETVSLLPACLRDQRGRLRKTDRNVGPIAKIIVRVKIGVQVGHADEAQIETPRGALRNRNPYCPRAAGGRLRPRQPSSQARQNFRAAAKVWLERVVRRLPETSGLKACRPNRLEARRRRSQPGRVWRLWSWPVHPRRQRARRDPFLLRHRHASWPRPRRPARQRARTTATTGEDRVRRQARAHKARQDYTGCLARQLRRLPKPFRGFDIVGFPVRGFGVHHCQIMRGPRIAGFRRPGIPSLRGDRVPRDPMPFW